MADGAIPPLKPTTRVSVICRVPIPMRCISVVT